MVAICHDASEWRTCLDEAHCHRFEDEHTIRLERDTVDELTDILEGRPDQGLEPGTVDCDQLEWIADTVAGVARNGIHHEERTDPQVTLGKSA